MGLTDSGWNSFARTNASDRFRKQSAQMGTPLTELTVREAHVEAGMRVLDVACGTGEPAISIATLLNGTGEVIAVDISAEPLKIGEQRARQRRLQNIHFQQADVHALPFPDARFDLVTCRLGLMFFVDLSRALREIRRVLRPGGRFTAVAWGPMEQPYFESTIGTVLKLCPELELPASGRAMFKFGKTGTLSAVLRETGFSSAHDEIREVDWSWPGTPEELWDYFRAVTIPFAPLLNRVPKEMEPEVDRAVLEALRARAHAGQVAIQGEFILGVAEA